MGDYVLTPRPEPVKLPRDTYNLRGELAQMGERRPCKAEVTGSNPVFST